MLIGELAKKTGLSKDTIRFYEKMGLIRADSKQVGTRAYKDFDFAIAEQLLLIKQAQGAGFTLREIKQVIDEWGSDIPVGELIRLSEQKLAQIDAKMQQLLEIKTYLVNKVANLKQRVS
jgi:MerR family transcriptional regulator, copper efflux regulator